MLQNCMEVGYSGQGSTSPKPLTKSDVQTQTYTLHGNLDTIQGMLIKLEERLSVVITGGHIGKQSNNSASVPQPVASSLASDLRSINHKAQESMDLLGSLLNRLDL